MAGENDEHVAQPWEALGYESFEDFVQAKEQEKEEALNSKTDEWTETAGKLQKQIEESQKLIQRQGNELGVLRKANGGKVETDASNEENLTDERETKFKESNIAREAALSAEQQTKLEEAYKNISPENKSLIKTEEGRHEFMNAVLGGKEAVADTFIRPKPEKKLSIQEQIKIALGQVESGAQPKPNRSASGVAFSKTAQKEEKKPSPTMSSVKTGDIRSMLKNITGE